MSWQFWATIGAMALVIIAALVLLFKGDPKP